MIRLPFRGLLASLMLATACDRDAPITASDFVPFGQTRSCPGTFTPRSVTCWDENDGGDFGFIPDMSVAEENQARLKAAGDRCVRTAGAAGVAGRLEVSFATEVYGGKYAPANCGAVWIEDAVGAYVRTLELWAGERQPSVVSWSASICGDDPTIADVVTGATLKQPASHTATWDTKDFLGNIVSDGLYSLWMQVTETEIFPEGPLVKFDFTKGSARFEESVETMRGFRDVVVTYSPTAPLPQPTAP